jgi:DNA modification methylase
MAELQVQYIDPQELKPFADNPRHHSERNIQDIQRSIKKFGFTNPILVRQEDNMVVAGHGRLQSAQELGLDEVPVIYLDFSENDAKLYAITDNRTAETSEWDLVALDELVQSLEMDEDELPDTGFYADELEEILAEVQEDVDLYADKDADAVPEVTEAITQEGDLWILGAHRVLCGDATRAEDVERLMDGQKADMVFTDPPYGVDYDGGIQFTCEGVKTGQRSKIKNDNLPIYLDAIPMMAKHTDGAIYTWFADTKAKDIYNAIDGLGDIHALLVWVKNGGYGAMNAQYKQKHEPCLYWKPKGKTMKWCGETTENTIWEIDKDGLNKLHPTQKPVALGVKAISNHEAGRVLDLFLGSGSTLIACEKTARQCYGLEIDPHYCDVIVQRYADFVESTQDITLVRDGQELSYESVS